MRMAQHVAAWEKSGGGWVNPYQTADNALVAMWDGEWNGDENNFVNIITGSKVAIPTGIEISNGSFVGNITCEISNEIFDRRSCWYEVVFSFDESKLTNQAHHVGFGLGNSRICGRRLSSGYPVLTYLDNKTDRWVTGDRFSDSNLRSYSCASFRRMCFCNGRQISLSNNYWNESTTEYSNKAIFYCNSTDGIYFIKCCRIYNRELSESEIAANCAIDKARFNLPDAA